MSVTHGGRAKSFDWMVNDRRLLIQSESRMKHDYSLDEVLAIVRSLHSTFGKNWFPLANNVEKMYYGTEQPGLGSLIYQFSPGNTLHAQGASYLGVVLEEVGVFEWNGEKRGICWRIRNFVDDIESIEALLSNGN